MAGEPTTAMPQGLLERGMAYTHKVVPASMGLQAAGQVLTVTQSTGLLTRGLVETTVGFYSLGDGISVSKGEELTLQTRANRRRYLCDASHRCTPLL